jgi:hypothetical protein
MAQRTPVVSKHYYRRWFLGLTLCPAYRFYHEYKKASRFKRFNTTASYFDFEDVLTNGFEDWWDRNQIKLQSAIPTDHLQNIQISYSLTSNEIERLLSQKKAEHEFSLSEENLQLDNLTIIDTVAGFDHKEIEFIDKIISTRIIRFIKEISNSSLGFANQSDYQKLKYKNIYDLVDPHSEASPKNGAFNSQENRISEWNSDFYRIFWYAQMGYFYYDSATKGNEGMAKERKKLEAKTPNFLSKGDMNASQAQFFDISLKEKFMQFIDPSKDEFFSIEKLIKIIAAFCPETLDYSKHELINRLPSPTSSLNSLPHINNTSNVFIKFPDDLIHKSLNSCDMWIEIQPYLEPLFANEIQLKIKSAYKIAEIFLDHTEATDNINSINQNKLKIISLVLPFLFQSDNKSTIKSKYASLDLLWKQRPNLFIETDNMFFGKTILIRDKLNVN